MTDSKSLPLSASDLNDLSKVLFEVFDSYDQKDWDRLRRTCAETLRIEYGTIGFQDWPEMSLDDYIALMSAPNFLGDARTLTQHLVGASFYERVSESEVVGRHQVRAAHQIYADADRKEVRTRGTAIASNTHWYRQVDGVWKFAGLSPKVLWEEDNFGKVFAQDGKPKE